jgi:AcrR family transcriptional regulator
VSIRGQRRDQIVAVARQLVAEGGLEALTIGKIEAKVPFTRGVITYHFDNKAEIVDAVLLSAIEEIDRGTFAQLATSGSLREQVAAVLGGMIRGFRDHSDASQILMTFWSRIPRDPHAAAVNQALYARYRGYAAELIRASGTDVDVEALSALLVAIVIGTVAQLVFEPGFLSTGRLVDTAVDVVMATLVGSVR